MIICDFFANSWDFLLQKNEHRCIMICSFILHKKVKVGFVMVSYKPLRVFMAKKEITPADCRGKCNISPNTWTKINNDEYVSLEILDRICEKYNLTFGDVVEYKAPEDKKGKVK